MDNRVWRKTSSIHARLRADERLALETLAELERRNTSEIVRLLIVREAERRAIIPSEQVEPARRALPEK